MKQRGWFFAGAAALLIIIIILVVVKLNKTENSSFTINLYGDFTSSGSDRKYNASLTFYGEKLVSGWQTYATWDREGQKVVECVIDTNSLTWVDKTTGGECSYIPESFPLTKEGIMHQIDSGMLKPAEECRHYDTCYRITYILED
jgi:hypothetical protein